MCKKKLLKIFARVNIALGIFAVLFAITTVLFLGFPQLFHFFNISSAETELATLTQSIESDFERYNPDKEEIEEIEEEVIRKPELDTNLPKEKILQIPKIGVETEILEGDNYIELLEQGVWKANEFGSPEDDLVMILAAHRYGYITWTSEYRDKNSFYHLPKTRVGDTVEIIWEQRLYEYEIYKIDENTEITDYNADLILYTCKLFNSPERIFRYARRIN